MSIDKWLTVAVLALVVWIDVGVVVILLTSDPVVGPCPGHIRCTDVY